MKIFNVDSDDYVVSGSMELAAEKYADVRGRDATEISLYKSDDYVILSDLEVALTITIDETAATAGCKVYPEAPTGYVENDLVVLTAVPDPTYTFTQWENSSGTVLSTNTVYSFNIQSDTEVVAIFTLI